jgi:predicted DNA-binding transcriptional regulator AlpA
MNFLRMTDLQRKFSVSRKTLWRWRKAHGFPKPVQIGGEGIQLWIKEEVEEWAQEKAQRTA